MLSMISGHADTHTHKFTYIVHTHMYIHTHTHKHTSTHTHTHTLSHTHTHTLTHTHTHKVIKENPQLCN